MFHLRKWFASLTQTVPSRAPERKARPSVQALEERRTPSLYSGYSHVNSSTALGQHDPVVASSPAGGYVVVWEHQYSISDTDIRAQRYS